MTWRQATRQEIQEYYNSEFPQKVSNLPEWITPNGPKGWALGFREEHPAKRNGDNIPPRDFVRRDTRQRDGETPYIESWEEVVEFIQQPASNDPLALAQNRRAGLEEPSETAKKEPVPAHIYYNLDHWEQFWVLAFDIDAKDVAKERVANDNQDINAVTDEQLDDHSVISAAPTPDILVDETEGERRTQQYKYEFQDIKQSLEYAFELKTWLNDTVGFDDVKVFYTGQGAHIYAFSDDPYYKYTYQSRQYLVDYIRERLHIPIDAQVTWDSSRVMRLPHSLHTDVCRVVTEIDSPDYDFRTDPLPEFLKEGSGNEAKAAPATSDQDTTRGDIRNG